MILCVLLTCLLFLGSLNSIIALCLLCVLSVTVHMFAYISSVNAQNPPLQIDQCSKQFRHFEKYGVKLLT